MRRAAPVAVLVALVLAAAAPAGGTEAGAAHLRLTKSSPAKDAILTAPVAEIRLWFSLPPELAVSRIRVAAAGGQEVELGKVVGGDDDSLAAAVVGDMRPGTYEVTWRTSSGDGHPIRGSFTFTLAAPDGAPR
jgi:methionine-rich copper-binding protein CopC